MTGRARQAGAYVKRKIDWLAETKNRPAAKAILAGLRQSIGQKQGNSPNFWGAVLGDMPDALPGTVYGGWAAYAAMALYALHRQDGVLCVNKDGVSLGEAVRRLAVHDRVDGDATMRRFHLLAASGSREEFFLHLQVLVQMLRAWDIPLDYPALTEDLYWLQFSGGRNGVRLKWGRDFNHNKRGSGASAVTSMSTTPH